MVRLNKKGVKMNFGEAFEEVKKGAIMYLPHWKPDVKVKAQYPDKNSMNTHPYLYVESRIWYCSMVFYGC